MIIIRIHNNSNRFSKHDDDTIHGRVPWMYHVNDATNAANAEQSCRYAATAVHE